ncbi:MAG: zinc ribbon domain-containing protein [Candidatus Methanoplasma sp.]|nr:zinc ribbon domain-containing protein [Candidatus Methanoplasma sp.]
MCQSCGMPLENNEMKGTNSDGSRSGDYCLYCFANGAFTKEMTMEEMISLNIQYLDEWMESTGVKMTEEEAAEQLRQFLPTLKRWRC